MNDRDVMFRLIQIQQDLQAMAADGVELPDAMLALDSLLSEVRKRSESKVAEALAGVLAGERTLDQFNDELADSTVDGSLRGKLYGAGGALFSLDTLVNWTGEVQVRAVYERPESGEENAIVHIESFPLDALDPQRGKPDAYGVYLAQRTAEGRVVQDALEDYPEREQAQGAAALLRRLYDQASAMTVDESPDVQTLNESAMALWEACLDAGDTLDWLSITRERHGAAQTRASVAALVPELEQGWALAHEAGFDEPFDWEFCPWFLRECVQLDEATRLPELAPDWQARCVVMGQDLAHGLSV